MVGEKCPLCVCMRGTARKTAMIILHSNSQRVYGYDLKMERFDLPCMVNLSWHQSDTERKCIYLVFGDVNRHTIFLRIKSGAFEAVSIFIRIKVLPQPSNDRSRGLASNEIMQQIGVPINRPLRFSSVVASVTGPVLFQWEFGDGHIVLDESAKGFSSVSHTYNTTGCFHFSITVLYFSSKSRTTVGLSDNLFICSNLRSKLPTRDFGTRQIFSWKFYSAGHELGRVWASTVRLERDRNLIRRDIGGVASPRGGAARRSDLRRGRYRLATSIDDNKLMVVGHRFTYRVKITGGNHSAIGSFNFSHSPHDFLELYAHSGIDRFASYLVKSATKGVLIVHHRLGIDRKHIETMDEFDNFRVRYASDYGYKTGRPITVHIESTGMHVVGIQYKLVCDGVEVFENFNRTARIVKRNFTLSGVDVGCICTVTASIPAPSGNLSEYVVPGSKESDSQCLMSCKLTAMLTYELKVDGTVSPSLTLSTKKPIHLAVSTKACAKKFSVLFQTKNITKHRVLSGGTSTAVFAIESKVIGIHTVQLTAWNEWTNWNAAFNINFMHSITKFVMTGPDVSKLMTLVSFGTSPHEGTAVAYTWIIDEEISAIYRKYYYIFERPMVNYLEVVARNDVSTYTVGKSIRGVAGMTSLTWGNTQPVENVPSSKSYLVVIRMGGDFAATCRFTINGTSHADTLSVSPTKPIMYPVTFHRKGIYIIKADAWNKLKQRRSLRKMVIVDDVILGLSVRWTGNKPVYCVPFAIEIKASARKGSNVVCKIKQSDDVLIDVKAKVSLHGVISCSTMYVMTAPGDYAFTVTMRNPVSSKHLSTGIIKGMLSTAGAFDLSMSAQDVRIGSESILTLTGKLECPLLNCSIDYGDGTSELVKDVVHGTTMRHRYRLVGKYRISGNKELLSCYV